MRLKSAIIAVAIAASSVAAYAQKATEQSVKELIEVAQVRQQMETMFGFMEQQMSGQFSKKLRAGLASDATEDQLEEIKQVEKKLMQVMREEMSWERMQPIYIKIYQNNFSQEEVDGLVAFYRTPVGQSALKKMPQVMQSAMQVTQIELMPRVIKRLRAVMRSLRRKQAIKPSTAVE